MGTLQNQLPRLACQSMGGWATEDRVDWIRRIAAQMGYKGEKLSPAEWHAACDVARTSLAVQNADTLDEQLAGFGKIFEELVEAVQMLHTPED